MPKTHTVNQDGITSCCNAYTSIDEYSTEYCKKCYEEVHHVY